MREALASVDNGLPEALRPWIAQGLSEIAQFKQRELELERQLKALVRDDDVVRRWLAAPGVGMLGASALRASIGDIHRFPSGRHLSSWLGITAREYSSGEQRRLGRISKRGDAYLRTLLIHGARSALLAAHRAQQAGQPLDALRRWALEIEQRRGTNKATVAPANKVARILWAIARYDRRFDGDWSTRA